jgi:hypothetical protein
MFKPVADGRGLTEHVTELRSVGAELSQHGFAITLGKNMSLIHDQKIALVGSGFPIGDPQDAIAHRKDEAACGSLLAERINSFL